MFDATKELFWLNSKVGFLKCAQNEDEIGPFFNGAYVIAWMFYFVGQCNLKKTTEVHNIIDLLLTI